MTKHFVAKLKGGNELPPVETKAYGVAELIFNSNFTKLHYRIILKNIEKITSCQIHLGKGNQTGPVVMFLYGPVKHGISVNEGTITGMVSTEDLEGPLQGKTFENLVQAIEEMNAYVNVHTRAYARGEIRGKIKGYSRSISR
ncbi:CHRD domain-containing protein [Bacillus cereus]|uniref:CHRD domain-containing protein n=1 Tax=Bacillus arachidis TaxID=2819290 RepID=A0ABS3NSK5_9BACI|nr:MULTISPECIES: CHRD domain-containing protein [Bacillus]MBO1623909.1 CHRD domain-containing protein [Bacillus arachidis]PFE02352.1 CHRD domain-containing protein [Bacillus sp. AFS023182]PGX96196.1 CHRD domain-containing protein [Bacillus cereus]SDZ29764.1 CHRD domain-containing protein [Bacillus sp. 166amftsu]